MAELQEYEDEILYPLATQQVQIDLDDGVKINDAKFGAARWQAWIEQVAVHHRG